VGKSRRSKLDRATPFCQDPALRDGAQGGLLVPEVGELLSAKYRVLSLLGAGGMGSVYRAENVLTGKQVAVKWMHPQYAASPDAAERLIREARAASKLSHPNVVDVYDVIRDGQTLFLVMELLQGESLRDYLRKQTRPPLHELISLMMGAMSGVAAAHAQGVIHRDLKPDNIFLERVAGMPHPIAKVLDFGIAKLAEHSDGRGTTLTQTGTAIGTPVYMSFEQLRGDKNLDHRTDVYAFGVMLYEASAGYPPFAAATLSELAIKVATTDAAPLKTVRPDAPNALCAIVDRAVRRARDERWPDVPSLMQALAPFAQAATFRDQMTFQDMTAPRVAQPRRVTPPALPSEGPWTSTGPLQTQQAPSVRVATPRPQHVPPDSLVARELDSDQPKSRTLPVWAAAAALLAVTVIATVLLLGDDEKVKPTETTTSTVNSPPETPPVAPPIPPPIPPTTGGIVFEPVQPQTPEPVIKTEPVQPVQPLKAPHDSANDSEQTGSRRRRRAERERERERDQPREEVPDERPAPRTEPVRAKPKNAGDLLGF
jgi:serine/threonine protein kinase